LDFIYLGYFMKKIGWVLCFAMLSSLAHADIIVRAAGADVCSGLPGVWNGSGNVSALGGLIQCKYKGLAEISETSDPSSFRAHINLVKTSGICPDSQILELAGTCHAGVITLKTDAVDLNGTLNDSGTTAYLAGDVTFEIPVVGKIIAHVYDMTLYKWRKV
jgi:hypothetical protein